MLRDVLRVIAVNPNTEHALKTIIESAQTLSGASGSCYILFDEPYLRKSNGVGNQWEVSDEVLSNTAARLPEGLHSDPPLSVNVNASAFHTLAAPIFDRQLIVGSLWLLFERPPQLREDDHALLNALVDALTIVTVRLRIEDIQERDRQLNASLMHSISDPLVVLDDDQNVILMNPSAERVFDTTSSAASGKDLRQVIQSEELIKIAQDEDTRAEWVTADDQTFIPRLQQVTDGNGNVEGWILALNDITRFKKLNRNQSEFMRIVSHDLRSPLTSMQGFASMLELGLVGELNEKQAGFIEKILAGITQITALVDNIQDAGRYDPETGFYEMARSQCDLGEMLHRVVSNQLVPAEKDLKISVNVADDVPIINADANMLERAMTNLVDNAIKYTPTGGEVEVGVQVDGGQVILSVRDTGLGISEEDQKVLFQRHRRLARQEFKKIKGSGLGLFIVRSVAQRHGGDAYVASKLGNGSTFYLTIPLKGSNLVVPGTAQ